MNAIIGSTTIAAPLRLKTQAYNIPDAATLIFGYDDARRLTRITDGLHFLYGANDELLAETDNDGNILSEYVYLNGQPLALYQPDDDNDGLSNAEEDPLGSNPANTDSDGDGLSNVDEWYGTGTDAGRPRGQSI